VLSYSLLFNTEIDELWIVVMQLQQEESSEAIELEDIPSFDGVPSFGTIYAPKSNIPEIPEEWKEKEAARIAEMIEKEGIAIRRRPATGPSMHKCGDFEFKLENEGNTPRNILEEIVWNTDVEVAAVSLL
jgi:hypothetical protein